MNDNPFVMLAIAAIAAYIGKLWLDDFRAIQHGKPPAKPFPGTTPCTPKAAWIAAAVAVLLVLIETAGEYALGVSDDQSTIVALYLLPMLAAAFGEELIFRGYLVISNDGRKMLYGSIIVFSLIFTLFHTQYYMEWEEGAAWNKGNWIITPKSAWTLFSLFTHSLWFYTVRFWPLNPTRSLLPCFAAHLATNLAVFLIKLAQGHVTGWW